MSMITAEALGIFAGMYHLKKKNYLDVYKVNSIPIHINQYFI